MYFSASVFQANHFNIHSADAPAKLKLMLTSFIVFLPGAENSSSSVMGPHGPEVAARLESGPRAAAHSPLAERNGFLQLRLHGYQSSFLMSTMRNLAHFLEDDSAPQVLPMEISVRDTHVHLKVKILDALADSVFH